MEFTSSEKCKSLKRTSKFSGKLELFMEVSNYYFFHNLYEYVWTTEKPERILAYNYEYYGVYNIAYT